MAQNKNLWNSIQLKKPAKSKFDLSHDVKMSCNMGELVPIMNVEVLPGDKFNISNQNLIRFAPMIAPVMHRMDVSTHYFFVPNRIMWDGWEKFIVDDPTAGAHPIIEASSLLTAAQKRYAGYYGVPIIPAAKLDQNINAFPFCAYNKIYNEYYRDQNLQSKLVDTLTDGLNDSADFLTMKYRAWEHDYFTSSLPFAQKGAAVDIPLGTVETIAMVKTTTSVGVALVDALHGHNQDVPSLPHPPLAADQLYADTKGLPITPTTINDLRRAYSLQKWLEKNARAGTRYVESLMAHFFVKAQDSRLQRPEYICGSKSPVIVSEVLNNTNILDQAPQGTMAGHGIATTAGNHGSYYAQEHGWIIGVMSVLPKPAYQQGFEKNYLKTDFLDYAFPEFANIGEQAVENREIWPSFTDQNVAEGTFGYVPRYSEYKYKKSIVAGNFLDNLDYWHLGRIFNSQPALNSDFIECKVAETTRIFAVTDDTVDHLFCQVVNNVSVVRALPFYGTPSI